ncbi:MAG: hypothetical protein ABIH21_00620 [Patescibacteria group bacterium]
MPGSESSDDHSGVRLVGKKGRNGAFTIAINGKQYRFDIQGLTADQREWVRLGVNCRHTLFVEALRAGLLPGVNVRFNGFLGELKAIFPSGRCVKASSLPRVSACFRRDVVVRGRVKTCRLSISVNSSEDESKIFLTQALVIKIDRSWEDEGVEEVTVYDRKEILDISILSPITLSDLA